MRDELFALLLRDTLIGDSGFEFMLTWLRCSLLQDVELLARAPLGFLCNLALQCFNNEFVYAVSEPEAAAVGALTEIVETQLRSLTALDEPLLRSTALLAMYRPLHTLGGVDTMMAATSLSTPAGTLLKTTVADVREETGLRGTIRFLGAVRDGVSARVRAMYEENPYPRWLSLDASVPAPAAQWVSAQLKGNHPSLPVPEAPRILVAGCGTGREAIALASEIRGAKVTAVDLSLSSLAYAKRKAKERGVANIEFGQADILELAGIPERFDIVCCVGVLHHMHDPQQGLQALCRLGRAGGLLRVGLYSARSRADLNLARALVREQGLPPTPSSIRAFRQYILAQDAASPLRGLLRYRDFFSMSECRDMLFHVQDHEFSLPQIAQMLRDNGLTLLAVANPAPPAILSYREMFPQDRMMADLEKWDAVEQRHPQAFPGIYQLWCRFPGSLANDGAG
jgi:2-polyprenyl-3-methyl-5-hydroxy-6-metoxy-1,4-benzoquinol methylase